MIDRSFPKQMRLLSRGDFRRVYEGRCAVGDEVVRLVGRLNELSYSRIGLSVSRECGNAVKRNRWKRLLREGFRQSRKQLPSGLDFVAIPRAAEPPELGPMSKSLVNLSWRLAKRLKQDESATRRDKRAEKNSRRARNDRD
ncbi:MAG TPA: ribonuclease P protein component [Pirellulales bacterium]|jgi:ribonuclease P protein component